MHIAVKIARGLEYLHVGCSQTVVHLDVKPQNILLDANLNPKLADFGIARLMDIEENLATITVAQGTRSYMAPEIHTIGSVSVKTDVYSFGVLLMEIIRGKSNVNIQHQDEARRFFPSWAKDKFRRGRYLDAVQDINNSVHLIPQFQKEEAKKMLYIAVSCIQDEMDRRPDMKTVLHMLEGRADVPMPNPRRHSISSSSMRCRQEPFAR
jgi:serine/threonine protein kinase